MSAWANFSNVGGRPPGMASVPRPARRRYQVAAGSVVTPAEVALIAQYQARARPALPDHYVRNTGAYGRIKKYDPGLQAVYGQFVNGAFASDSTFQCSPARGCATKRPVSAAVKAASAKRLRDFQKVAQLFFDAPENQTQTGDTIMSYRQCMQAAGELYRNDRARFDTMANSRVSTI